MRSRLPTAVRQNLEIKDLNAEIERLRARNKRLEEALEQVMAMMIERGSNNLPLEQMVRAALEDK